MSASLQKRTSERLPRYVRLVPKEHMTLSLVPIRTRAMGDSKLMPSHASLARWTSSLARLHRLGCLRNRRVNDHTVKIYVHLSINYRLAWQHFRRRIPRLPFHHPILDRFCDQSSDLFTLQRDQLLVAVILVKLRTIIQSMNPWVVSFQNEEVFGFKKNIVLCDDFLFRGGQCNAKLFS